MLSKEFAKKLPAKEIEKAERSQTLKMEGTVIVSSVGIIRRAEQNCRWIELKMRLGGDENILKILVPEKFLKRGEDPLDHAILTFFNPKRIDRANVALEEGFNRIGREKGFQSIAFPLIGAGSGGFNQDKSKAIMEDELGTMDFPMDVRMVVFGKQKKG